MASLLMKNSIILTDELANMSVEKVGIFPRGYVSLLVGEPGIGKTWVMLSIAKSVNVGGVGFGSPIDKYPKGRVLIFAGETGVRLLASRVKMMGGFPEEENVRVISSHVCSNLSIDTMLNTAIGRKNILEAVIEFKPDIVFFDTMISFMSDGKDESSQVDIGDCLRGVNILASQTKTACVLVHHFRKRSTQSSDVSRTMDDVIGSSAFTRLSSLVIGIDRNKSVRNVRCLKSWWEEFCPFSFKIAKSREGVIFLQQDYNYNVDGSYAPSKTTRLITDKIKEEFSGSIFTVTDIFASLDCSRSGANDAIAGLVARHEAVIVDKVGNTVRYRLVVNDDDTKVD